MSYARKNRKNVGASIVGVIALAAVAIWQFYSFVTFKDAHGGSVHLVMAIVMAALACAVGVLVFSVFVHHDTDDDLHITTTGRA
ncbi:MAG TPA: hypothetical protein VLL54_19790 [Pyrinomonadaceae bacterium]|nr:hypothetical protein [Pyrinomonadaceae bacterium]